MGKQNIVECLVFKNHDGKKNYCRKKGENMKKLLPVITVLVLASSFVFAADFNPTLLKLTAPKSINYQFDGSELSIPVTVTGAPSSTIFLVYTKDKSNGIGAVQNGLLGWHYVNQIDTCMYVSDTEILDIGDNTIAWDGKDADGNTVPEGDYTYYLWGYDSVNSKTMASYYYSFYYSGDFLTHNEDGSPKTKPEWYAGVNGANKWTIGNDPMDETLLETTVLTGEGANIHLEFHPEDHSYVFALFKDGEGTAGRVKKFQWVPNGTATLQEDWGEDGEYIFTTIETWSALGGVQRIDDVLYITNSHYYSSDALSELHYIDIEDGSKLREVDLSDWWSRPGDFEAGAQMNGGPFMLYERNNYLYGCSFCDCLRGAFDPTREDDDDVAIWYNGNGDYVGDHNFAEDADKPWVCMDFNVAPYAYNTGLDEHFFSAFGAYDLGAVSFGLIGPDGTGIDYLSFAGETADVKDGPLFIDYGSSYDGIYTDNKTTGSEGSTTGLWFIGHDSIKGVITNQVDVAEDSPAAFAVDQNSPNPFNPTTSISFKLAEAGNVSVEVFNVAGQKIDTVANEFMSSGSHSVTWNASGFSAGIYFYTVTSGDFSRTMKMTLLK